MRVVVAIIYNHYLLMAKNNPLQQSITVNLFLKFYKKVLNTQTFTTGEASHDDEEVARVVFRDIVANTLNSIRANYVAECKRLLAANQSPVVPNAAVDNDPPANANDPIDVVNSEEEDEQDNYYDTDDEERDRSAEQASNTNSSNVDAVAEAVVQVMGLILLWLEDNSPPEQAAQGAASFGMQEYQLDYEEQGVRFDALHSSSGDNSFDDDDSASAYVQEAHFGPTLQKLSADDARRRNQAFKDRFTLMIDGCNPQRQAMCGKPGAAYKGVIHEVISPEGHDVGKCSPECTMGQNPNDATRCHSQLKEYVRTKMKWNRRNHSDAMKVFIEQQVMDRGLEKGSLNTVLLFCGHLEQMICRVWLPDNIRSGWRKIGLISDTDPSGIDIKRILSGWIGLKDISEQNLTAIVDKIPLLAREIAFTTTVSDASMQQLQQYYPREWVHYKTDRSMLSTSRARASVLVADFESHKMRFLDEDKQAAAAKVTNSRAALAALPPPPRHHGYKDLANLGETVDRICDCKRQGFAGARTYKNTPVGWKNHQATLAHLNWIKGQDKTREEVIGASTFRPFSEHSFAQRAGVVRISQIAANLALSFEVAAKMAEFAQTVPIDDQDLPMFAAMRPAMFMQRFGMQHALAEQFSSQANGAIASAAAAQREFVLDQYADN
jgi:hypothetical protein